MITISKNQPVPVKYPAPSSKPLQTNQIKIMNQNTIINNNQFGIILLHGEPTIAGQLEARKKALATCIEEYKVSMKNKMLNPAWYNTSMLKSWIDNHTHQIEIFESLIN